MQTGDLVVCSKCGILYKKGDQHFPRVCEFIEEGRQLGLDVLRKEKVHEIGHAITNAFLPYLNTGYSLGEITCAIAEIYHSLLTYFQVNAPGSLENVTVVHVPKGKDA